MGLVQEIFLAESFINDLNWRRVHETIGEQINSLAGLNEKPSYNRILAAGAGRLDHDKAIADLTEKLSLAKEVTSFASKAAVDSHQPLIRAFSGQGGAALGDQISALSGGVKAFDDALALYACMTVWQTRPIWVRNPPQFVGSLDIHYILGMVGLTVDFNNQPDTTFAAVQQKFTMATVLAILLGI